MGTITGITDRIVVMYGGRTVEASTTQDIFDQPQHPYTQGLINCLPKVSTGKGRLTPIPGIIPSLIDPPEGCIFESRCDRRMPICISETPPEVIVPTEHLVACHLYSPLASPQYKTEDVKDAN